MKLSMKTDYAMRVLFTLVEHYGEGPIPIRELARRNDVPKPFLEHIMLDLKEQGWVRSVAGNRGGYVLARKPDLISLGEVIRFFDGVLAPISCVSIAHYERCSQEPVCRLRRFLLDVRNYTARIMDQTSLAAVVAGEAVAPDERLDAGADRSMAASLIAINEKKSRIAKINRPKSHSKGAKGRGNGF